MSSAAVSKLALATMVGLLLIGTISLVIIGFDDRMGIDFLRRYQYELLGYATSRPMIAAVVFMLIYAAAVAASVPGLAVLTMAGGFLFDWVLGTVYTMVATTIASTGVFLLARSAFGAALRRRAGPAIMRFADHFREDALTYVFVLHLIPIFPYVMVITLPAAVGVPLPVFMFAAFFGILPATILLAHVGSGLGEVLRQEGTISVSSFMTPEIVFSLIGLALLALLPVVYRAIRGNGQPPRRDR
jgi:uncharacterized membrane protein YdjX (TVP38/TMEM64 family)